MKEGGVAFSTGREQLRRILSLGVMSDTLIEMPPIAGKPRAALTAACNYSIPCIAPLLYGRLWASFLFSPPFSTHGTVSFVLSMGLLSISNPLFTNLVICLVYASLCFQLLIFLAISLSALRPCILRSVLWVKRLITEAVFVCCACHYTGVISPRHIVTLALIVLCHQLVLSHCICIALCIQMCLVCWGQCCTRVRFDGAVCKSNTIKESTKYSSHMVCLSILETSWIHVLFTSGAKFLWWGKWYTTLIFRM